MLVWKGDLHVHFQTTRTQKSIIDHIHSIGHTDKQDVVELVNTVEFGQQLVDNTVAHTSTTACSAASLLAYSVQFVEDDDMKPTLIALLFVLLLGICEELSNILFRLTNIFVQYFRAIDDLWFPGIKHLANLSSDQGLTGTRRTIQKDTLDVLNAELLDQTRREDTSKQKLFGKWC